MSQINDALKRARLSQQQNSSGAPPLPPVENRSRGGTGWFLPTLVILLVAGACFFIGLAFAKKKSAAENPAAGAATVVSNPAKSTVVLNSQTVAIKTNSPATSEEKTAAVLPVSPELKVQGIFYVPAKPRAIVNGKTVGVGGRVGDFRVKTISKSAVTFIASDGTEKSFRIGE